MKKEKEVKQETVQEVQEEQNATVEQEVNNEEVNSEILKLQEENAELTKKAEEYKNSWYRAAADFENYKKRNSEVRSNAYFDGKSDAIKAILPIGDNLDRALATCKDEQTKNGLELVVKQFAEILKNVGVEEINPVGEVFDPNLHEAVHQVEAEEGDQSGNIKSVFKKGYRLSGKMIRYAQVIVIK